MTNSDFHEWRSRGIGASDIAGILNLSPWSSPYSVWASKVLATTGGGTSGSMEAMRWGKLLEDAVIDEAARRLNVYAYGQQTRCTHPDYEWARATVDAFCKDDDTEGVIEAKTTSDYRWYEVPVYYEAQVLWQLAVTGRSFGWLAALHAGRKLSLWRIDEQPALQRAMLDTGREFWESFIVPGVPPPVDGLSGTGDALDAVYAETVPGATVAFDDEYAETVAALRRVRGDIRTLEEDRDLLENRIKAALGTAESGTVDGRVVVTWKAQHSRRIDLDLLRERYPTEAASCETITDSRRFLIKGLPKSAKRD